METFLHDFKDGNGLVLSHRHKNGGGIVASTAEVSDDSIVAPNAQVGGKAMVLNKCKILDNAKVIGNAYVSDGVVLEDYVEVSGSAEVKYGVVLFGDAKVSVPPKLVIGFEHPVIITDTHIFMGCHCFDIEEWKRAAPIIKVNGYTTKMANYIHSVLNGLVNIHFDRYKDDDEIRDR